MMWALQVVLIALTGVAGEMTATWRTQVVSEHNKARTTLANPPAGNMMTVVYNMSMESMAQKYLDTMYPSGCEGGFVHNPNRGDVGENWYSGQPAPSESDPGATAAWTTEGIVMNTFVGRYCSERDNFYSLNGCVQAPCYNADGTFNTAWNTGHFTQVMWATTAQIGCGYKSGCGTVCNYYPAGNADLPSGLLAPSAIWKPSSAISHPLPKKLRNPLSLLTRTTTTHPPTTTHTPTTTTCAPTTTTPTTTPAPTTTTPTTTPAPTTTTPAPTTTTPTTTVAPTTTPSGPCFAANDPLLSSFSPTSPFTCSSTFATDCTVCGVSNATQVGSNYLTVSATVTCTDPVGPITAFPGYLGANAWSIMSSYTTAATTSTVTYQVMTISGGPASLLAEWCIGGEYFAAFPITVTHASS